MLANRSQGNNGKRFREITASEHELIHGLTDFKQRIDYMNWRLVGATLHAVRIGMPVNKLVQFDQK